MDGAKMFQEMLRVRWYDMTGKYHGRRPVSASAAKSLSERPAPRI
jgi:hypothetical protein